MYCIYSGREIDAKSASIEHIIPLSLGGCDEFSICVEEKINSQLGSEVDGKLSQDFLIALDRVREGTRGHSRKTPEYSVKSKGKNGRPIITTFKKGQLEIFDPIEKKYISSAGEIQLQASFNLYLRSRFLAKVALATGYYLFGDKFVAHADCDSLRALMMCNDPKESASLQQDAWKEIRFYDTFTPIKKEDQGAVDTYKLFCKYISCSNVMWTYSPESIIVHVGLFDKFIGCINFKADVNTFPLSDDFWAGHVLLCRENQLVRGSWRSMIIKMCEDTNLLSKKELEAARAFERTDV